MEEKSLVLRIRWQKDQKLRTKKAEICICIREEGNINRITSKEKVNRINIPGWIGWVWISRYMDEKMKSSGKWDIDAAQSKDMAGFHSNYGL